ncbi:zinc finger protein OZF-like isoform X2 [Homarus americanus]|uniref:zinc finger protein OZF-like isoform X2 n=1 Tax=Homarus americanus TaxID=6706 RepID=UPI001C47A63F|nr:zinc finger protein OZF-like isoform X2 [Homarus americanus]
MENNKSYCSCTECGRVFAYQSYLTDHMKTHIDEKPSKTHIDGNVKNTMIQPSQGCQVSVRLIHPCNACGKTFSHRSNLMQHMKVHTPDRPYSCCECGKTFPRKSSLSKHIVVHSSNKPFKCNECGKSFSTKSAIFLHNSLHTGEKPFKCAVCGESFYQKFKLTDHHRQHHLCDGSFTCKECGKSHVGECGTARPTGDNKTPTSENDKNETFSDVDHTNTLNVNVLNKCDICGRTCSCRSSLQLHMRTHVREKPLKCSLCKKTFTQKSSLTEHMNLHSGHKPYICNQCGKSYSLKSTLILHMRIHTGDRPFKCLECGENFYQKSKLTNHKRLYHFHDRPFGCNICGKTFVEKCELDEHLIKHGIVNLAGSSGPTSPCQATATVDRTRKKYIIKPKEIQKSTDVYSEPPPDCVGSVKTEHDSIEYSAVSPSEHLCFVKTEDDMVEYYTNSIQIESDPLEVKTEANS